MAMTGALFALLVAATTFTLVLRILGTDRLVADWVTALPGSDDLGGRGDRARRIGLCAFVLDAFEIIFVIVPIVVPPLLMRVADARWVAVLMLLTLQASFLLPPFGYALMMVRGTLRYAGVARRTGARAVAVSARAMAGARRRAGDARLAHVGEKEADRTACGAACLHRGDQPAHGQMLTPIPDSPDYRAAAEMGSGSCLTPSPPPRKPL